MRTSATCTPDGIRKWLTGVIPASAAMMSMSAGDVTFDFEENPLDSSILHRSTQEIWSESTVFRGLGNPGGFLSITEAVQDQSTTVVFPDIDDGAMVRAFTLAMDIRVGNGSGSIDPANGSYGFSVSYTRGDDPLLQEPYTAFAFPGVAEKGARSGVVVSFENRAGRPRYGVYSYVISPVATVHVDSVFAGGGRSSRYSAYGSCDDPASLSTGRYTRNSAYEQFRYGLGPRGGNPDSLCWQPLEISLDDNGFLDVKYKGNFILEDFLTTDFFPGLGRVVLAGRTGLTNEIVHVDNLRLRTVRADKAPDKVQVQDFTSTANHFEISFRDVGDNRIDESTVSTTLDGNDITPDTVIREGIFTIVSYSQAEFWPSGDHVIGVEAEMDDGSTFSRDIPFTVEDYTLVGADLKLDGPFDERGFLMRVLVREKEVDYDGSDYEPDAHGYVKVDGKVNFALKGFRGDSEVAGVFRSGGTNDVPSTDAEDAVLPGFPGNWVSRRDDNLTTEILAVVEVPEAGLYRWAFNASGGFRTTAGRNTTDLFEAVRLGGFDGGHGPINTNDLTGVIPFPDGSDGGHDPITTHYTVAFEEPGFYRVRHIWSDDTSGDGASLEWWLADQDGNPVALFNDDRHGGLRIYRDNIAPDSGTVLSATPGADAKNVDPAGAIELVVDGTDGLDDGSVSMTVDGVTVVPDVVRQGSNTTISHIPSVAAPLAVRSVTVNYSLDGTVHSRSWQYTVEDYSVTPGVDAKNVNPAGAIELVVDGTDGLDDGSVSMTVDGVTVVPDVVRQGSNTTISHIPSVAAPLAVRSVTVNYSLDGTVHSRSWQYTVEDYPSLDCATGTAPGSGSGRGFNFFAFLSGGDIFEVPPAEERSRSDGDGGDSSVSGSFGGVVNFVGLPWGTRGNFHFGNGHHDRVLPGTGRFEFSEAGAIEFTAYVEFPEAGYYRMGVGCNHGFKVSSKEAGDRDPADDPLADALGFFDTEPGFGVTEFGFDVPVAGVYPMRLLWFNGSGTSVEWTTVRPDGTHVLLNDDDGILAYRQRSGAVLDCPAGGGAISVARDEEDNVVITYEGTLQSSDRVDGTYVPVEGAGSPYTVPTGTGASRFYISR